MKTFPFKFLLILVLAAVVLFVATHAKGQATGIVSLTSTNGAMTFNPSNGQSSRVDIETALASLPASNNLTVQGLNNGTGTNNTNTVYYSVWLGHAPNMPIGISPADSAWYDGNWEAVAFDPLQSATFDAVGQNSALNILLKGENVSSLSGSPLVTWGTGTVTIAGTGFSTSFVTGAKFLKGDTNLYLLVQTNKFAPTGSGGDYYFHCSQNYLLTVTTNTNNWTTGTPFGQIALAPMVVGGVRYSNIYTGFAFDGAGNMYAGINHEQAGDIFAGDCPLTWLVAKYKVVPGAAVWPFAGIVPNPQGVVLNNMCGVAWQPLSGTLYVEGENPSDDDDIVVALEQLYQLSPVSGSMNSILIWPEFGQLFNFNDMDFLPGSFELGIAGNPQTNADNYGQAILADAACDAADVIGDSLGRVQLSVTRGYVDIGSYVSNSEVPLRGNLGLDASGNVNFGLTTMGSSAQTFGGSSDVTIGNDSGADLTAGTGDTGVGTGTMQDMTTGSANTAVGHNALQLCVSGVNNTGVGASALLFSTGSGNVGIGSSAGYNLTSGNNDIDIGNAGLAGESDVTRIGTIGTQTNCYIAGNPTLSTNSTVIAPAIAGFGQLEVSNGWLYWVTPNHTNLLSTNN